MCRKSWWMVSTRRSWTKDSNKFTYKTLSQYKCKKGEINLEVVMIWIALPKELLKPLLLIGLVIIWNRFTTSQWKICQISLIEAKGLRFCVKKAKHFVTNHLIYVKQVIKKNPLDAVVEDQLPPSNLLPKQINKAAGSLDFSPTKNRRIMLRHQLSMR